MKKIVVSILVVLLLSFYASNIQAEMWAKPFEYTKSEFSHRYEHAPSSVYGDLVPLVFIDTGIANYRKVYYAEVGHNMSVTLICEDLSDKVALLMIRMNTVPEMSYENQKIVGQYLVQILNRSLFALDGRLWEAQDILVDKLGYSGEVKAGHAAEYDKDGLSFAISISDEEILIAFRLTDYYDSQDAYLAGRQLEPKTPDPVEGEVASVHTWSNLSLMSDEDLLELKARIESELLTRGSKDSFNVTPGRYIVGPDIPAGTYKVTVSNSSVAGGMIVVYPNKSVMDSQGSYILMEVLSGMMGNPTIGKIELTEGQGVWVSNGMLSFEVYTGLGD